MGSFEKLGILVIVVIIVMILAVAIHQWGTTAAELETGGLSGGGLSGTPALSIDSPPDRPTDRSYLPDDGGATAGDPNSPVWPGGVPRQYRIRKNDKVWVLVFRKWGLEERFVNVIRDANPKIDFNRLRPGDTLTIPNPAKYYRTQAKVTPRPKTRRYRIQGGDSLESIAKTHLGDRRLWPRIEAANPGIKPKNLKIGQVILIPVK